MLRLWVGQFWKTRGWALLGSAPDSLIVCGWAVLGDFGFWALLGDFKVLGHSEQGRADETSGEAHLLCFTSNNPTI